MVSDVFELVGKVISFDYPAANYQGVRLRMERRRLRVDRVQDTECYPVPEEDIAKDPHLKRSRYLITGMDVDKAEPRSFYDGSMQGVQVVNLPRVGSSYAMLVIRKPENWAPASPKDEPEQYRPEWVELTGMPKRSARDISRSFNASSMKWNGKTWSVILPELGRTGGRAA